MDDVDIDDLKEETERTDRLGEEESDSEEDELDINYRSFDDVVRTQAPGDDIIDLKNQTRRTTRLEERDETVDLDPFEELDLEGEPFNEVDDHYCGNCVHVKFRKSTGRPQVYCTKWGQETRLEPEMACPEYYPQGFMDKRD